MIETRKKNGNYSKSQKTKDLISEKMKIVANGREFKNNKCSSKC